MFAPKIAKPQTKTAVDSISRARPRSTLAAQRHSPVEQALLLQRTISNQATLRLLSQCARNLTENEPHGHNEQEADPARRTTRAAIPGVSWDFSKTPLFSSDRPGQVYSRLPLAAPPLPDSLQPKLAVGQVNDPLEHEVDRIADQAMHARVSHPMLRSIRLAESFVGEGPDRNTKEPSGPEGGETEEPASRASAAETVRTTIVSATFAGTDVKHEERPGALSPAAKAGRREVKPTGTPTYDGAAASSTCLPADILPADVDWGVTDKGKKWGVKITAFRTSGEIKVNPTPNLPTTMTTPNTPNPVDSGNINDTVGSNNYWKFAVDEMRGYNKRGGGRSLYWHSTAASDAHEYAHWNIDWLKNVLGGLWPKANRDIDAITIPKAAAADATAAQPLLKTKVDARIAQANTKSTRDWNGVPDEPGLAGANGYEAGQRVLNGLIDSVRAYARSKKWK